MKAQSPAFLFLWLLLLEHSASAYEPIASTSTGTVEGGSHRALQEAAQATATAPAKGGSAGQSGLTVPLQRRDGAHAHAQLRKRDANAVANWAKKERSRLLGRYGPGDEEEESTTLQPLKKRQSQQQDQGVNSWYSGYYSGGGSAGAATATGTSTSLTFRPETTGGVGQAKLTNYLADLEYYAPVQVGSPSETFNVILDTGSSDFWLASTGCSTDACGHVPRYNTSKSNSSHALGNDFSIKYGDGTAEGTMYNDTVTLAGLNATSDFAACESVSEDMITGNVSGIMGLGFEALAASDTVPFWQHLINNSIADQAMVRNGTANISDLAPFHNLSFPGFSFALTRYINLSHPDDAAPGGLFTLGTLSNESYTGNITYIDIPSDELSYWYIPMESIQLNSTNVTGIDSPNVAIDTGTTLIGGPSKAVASLYSLIPGAKEATDEYSGYWTYPCNETFSVSFGFGGRLFNMTDEDFNLGVFEDATNTSAAQCLGAFFELSLSQGTSAVISWVIGSAFLKNVYSVYRLAPNVSVGFADLNEESLDQYYPDSPQPASTERVKGGGPFGPPDAPSSGSAAASATGRRDSASADTSSAQSTPATAAPAFYRSIAVSIVLGLVFALALQA